MKQPEEPYFRSEIQQLSYDWDVANTETLRSLRAYLKAREHQLKVIELTQGQERQLKGKFLNIVFLGSAAQYDPLEERNGNIANALPPDRYIVDAVEVMRPEYPEVLLIPLINPTGIAYRVAAGNVQEARDHELDYGGTDMHPSLEQVQAWQEENIDNDSIARN